MKTTAAILYQLNSPLVIKQIDTPELKPGQVLVKVLASGICRSQLNEIKGLKGPDKFLPHVLGHEGSAEVLAVGSAVTKVKPGDFVVLSWIKGTGLDTLSATYTSNHQIINSGPIATFSEHAVVSENRVTKISNKIPYDKAALLGCAIATGAGIVLHKLHLSTNSTLAVFGVGGIGSSVILGAKMYRPRKIIAIDVNRQTLQYAKKIGATHALYFDAKTIVDDLHALCPDGVDYVIEASGNKTAMEKTIETVQNYGLVVIAGNIGYTETIQINPFEFIKGKTITGTWGGETNPDTDFAVYSEAYTSNRLDLKALLTRRVRLEDINEVIKDMADHKQVGRTIIDFT